jgi:hypothetical protein
MISGNSLLCDSSVNSAQQFNIQCVLQDQWMAASCRADAGSEARTWTMTGPLGLVTHHTRIYHAGHNGGNSRSVIVDLSFASVSEFTYV